MPRFVSWFALIALAGAGGVAARTLTQAPSSRALALTAPLYLLEAEQYPSDRAMAAVQALLAGGPEYRLRVMQLLLRRNPEEAPDELLKAAGPFDAEQLTPLALSVLDPNRAPGSQLAYRYLEKAWVGSAGQLQLANSVLVAAEDPRTPPRRALLQLSLLGFDPRWEFWSSLSPTLDRRVRVVGRQRCTELGLPYRCRDDEPARKAIEALDHLADLSDAQVRSAVAALTPEQQLEAMTGLEGLSEGSYLWARSERTGALGAAAATRLFFCSTEPHARDRLAPFLNAQLADLARVPLTGWDGKALAAAFPRSRFALGCRDYARLRGEPYFIEYRDELKDGSTPPGTASGWKKWLKSYGDHPGADDASYWLVRRLEWEGHREAALERLLACAVNCPGDRSAEWRLRDHLWWMLDVGASADQLQMARQHLGVGHPFEPLLRYAVALRSARAGRFTEALSETEGLSLESKLFHPEWADPGWSLARPELDRSEVHMAELSLDSQLAAQRSIWKSAVVLENPSTPEGYYRLAQAWLQPGGWRLGYFVPHCGTRAASMTYTFHSYALDRLHVSDGPMLAREAAGASQNAVAYRLLGRALADPNCPAWLVEKALHDRVMALYHQYSRAPLPETEMVGPLPGFAIHVDDVERCYCLEGRAELKAFEQRCAPSLLLEDARDMVTDMPVESP